MSTGAVIQRWRLNMPLSLLYTRHELTPKETCTGMLWVGNKGTHTTPTRSAPQKSVGAIIFTYCENKEGKQKLKKHHGHVRPCTPCTYQIFHLLACLLTPSLTCLLTSSHCLTPSLTHSLTPSVPPSLTHSPARHSLTH